MKPKAAAIIETAEPPARARTFRMGEREIATINAKVRYDTWVVFPPGEFVTLAGGGDLENWEMLPADAKKPSSVFHVKPSVVGMASNLHLQTNKGNYSFWVREISKSCPTCQPDVKIFIDPIEQQIVQPAATDESDKQIRELTGQLALLRQEKEIFAEDIQTREKDLRAKTQQEISQFKSAFPASLRCDYKFKRNKDPFEVAAICSDGEFTYLFSRSDGIQSIYESRTEGPALVQSTYQRAASGHAGVYILNGIVTKGFMRSGKKKMSFQTEKILVD